MPGDPTQAKLYCPHCAGDISFMREAFDRKFYPLVPTATTTSTFTSQVAQAVRLDDAVYSRDLQGLLWQRMHEKVQLYTAMPVEEVVANAVAQKRPNRQDGSVVMHLIFDRDVTPAGGVIHSAVRSVTATQPTESTPFDEDRLTTMGYVVIPNERRVQTVDDIPVGPLWNTLQYWGGERQHRRWHMARPVEANPHRNACPAFMDGRLCGVQVWYDDELKAQESLVELAQLCAAGVNGSRPAGVIRAIMLA